MASEHVVANCMMLCVLFIYLNMCFNVVVTPACLTFTEGEYLDLFDSRKPTSTYKQKDRVTLLLLYPRVYM